MGQRVLSRLDVAYHPAPITLHVPYFARGAPAAEKELRSQALYDVDKCCGYFPALAGADGIVSDLPDCRIFAAELPRITHGGSVYHFNFLRLSLVQQSAGPEYHLDSDASTALTGDVATLRQRHVLRMVLNLSAVGQRAVHYLDIDSQSIELIAREGYVRIARTESLEDKALTAVIPPRRGATVHGLVFVSNRVLHSGVDDESGHFIAAYGTETDEAVVDSSVDVAQNALSTRSRTPCWSAGLNRS
jgi:hypothetical protein